MAHGKTLEMKMLSKVNRWKTPTEREPVERDRSLRGKARIKTRRAARAALRQIA